MNPTYTDKGSLQIFVTAGETPDPIPEARVRITDPTDGRVSNRSFKCFKSRARSLCRGRFYTI